MGRKQGLLLRVERFSRQHYKLVFVLAALALVAGSWLGSRLELESNVLDLIPEGNRQVDTFKAALADFGAIDYLVVLVDAQEGQSAEDLQDFADLFAENLRAREDLVELVDKGFRLDEDFVDLLYGHALLFLPPDRLPELADKLTDEAIREQLAENRLAMASPAAATGATGEFLRRDPLGLFEVLFRDRLSNRGVLPIDITDGYYLSRDGRSLILLVKPTGPSQDIEFDERLMPAVLELERETRRQYAEETGQELSDREPRVRYGGNYAIAVDEAKLIRKDVKRNLFVSLFAISALYWLCYRRFAALLYSSLPLLVGQALTFALAFFVLGGLNASSSAFTALLMGLGTDFVIVVYARYVEERRKGRSLAEATELMIGETGLGVFTGAITSAGTFYAMCISQFRGLTDLGFLIGSGILMCALVILFLLPAMIKWNEGVRRRKVDSVKKLHLQSFLLEHLIPFSARHRVPVIAGVLLLTAGSVFLARQLEFDDTVSVLRSERSPAYRVQKEMQDRFGASLSYMMAIVETANEAEAVELTADVRERLRPFLEDGTIASFDSIVTYLPPPSEQRAVIDAVAEVPAGAFDAERVRRTFLEALEANGFRREPFEPFLGRLDSLLSPRRTLALDDLREAGLERLLGRYVHLEAGDGAVRVVTYLYTSDPRWKRDPPPGLVDTLSAGDDRIVVTGTNVVGREFRRIFTREAPRALLLGLAVVFALLWIDFRSLRLTAVAMAQLVCGVAMMLGLMKVTGIHLNFVNAFVATMILGVGIDYSIHLVHRMSLSGGALEPGLLETGKAVVIAALTNIAGFGTLILGAYPALRSFGLVALYGSLTCLFTSLTLVPALMARREAPVSVPTPEE